MQVAPASTLLFRLMTPCMSLFTQWNSLGETREEKLKSSSKQTQHRNLERRRWTTKTTRLTFISQDSRSTQVLMLLCYMLYVIKLRVAILFIVHVFNNNNAKKQIVTLLVRFASVVGTSLNTKKDVQRMVQNPKTKFFFESSIMLEDYTFMIFRQWKHILDSHFSRQKG